jgi:hypothetical protein
MPEFFRKDTPLIPTPTPPFPSPAGVPKDAFNFMLVVMALLIAVTCYFAQHQPENSQCVLTNTTMQGQSDAQKAQGSFNARIVQRDEELRMKVVTACVERGGIPVYAGGNVDCKAAPK